MRAEFEEYLESTRRLIDRALEETVKDYPCEISELKEVMDYSLWGGKRLRGVTLLSIYEGLGGSKEQALPFALGLEMIHAYSLVHDDLPCMDNDEYRRGRLTCHKRFGEAMALLCGDALLTLAFEVMLSARGVDPRCVTQAARSIARAAGIGGMVGGQVLDLQLEGKKSGKESVTRMYRLKTGALFQASAEAGAMLWGAPREVVESVSRWGCDFGYAYQIIDDLEDSRKAGKEETKDTLVKESSIEEVFKEAGQALQESLGAISALGESVWFLRGLSRRYAQNLESLRRGILVE
ncbi:MAG TPA: polyprenyl synthetase family protein [Firmicutes bacterium]|nr:polyprenyl synthetase family protein [Candidatus Fermentithermobacillaceae bacterium]